MPSTTDIRVAIVENDDLYRESLVALIQGEPGLCCVGHYATAERALRALAGAAPDVVLLDLRLPRLSGLEAIPQMAALLPRVHIIVLTIEDSDSTLFQALELGAVGYLNKPVGSTKIVEAIREAMQGGAPMTSQIARMVVDSFRRRGAARKDLSVLSKREEEILASVAEGLQNSEIAVQLGISPRTVATHLCSIYEKLQVHNRSAAARFLR